MAHLKTKNSSKNPFDRTILTLSFFHQGDKEELFHDVVDLSQRYGDVVSIIHNTRRVKKQTLHEFYVEFKRSADAKDANLALQGRTLDCHEIRAGVKIMKIWS